jgi:hypothetical protein
MSTAILEAPIHSNDLELLISVDELDSILDHDVVDSVPPPPLINTTIP